MKKVKVCSLFSGAGGFESGLLDSFGEKKCNFVFASEIDKFAARAYELIWGHKPHGDIRQVNEKKIPDHDLLVAGFPCQAFSIAGKKLGFDEARGTLFFEVARIAREKKPKIILLENVKNLLSHANGDTFSTIISVLSEIGYKVDFTLLNSKHFHVAQSRERVFIVAMRDVDHEEWDLTKAPSNILKVKQQLLQLGGLSTFNFSFPKNNEITSVMKDVLEEQVVAKYYMKNEVTERLLNEIKAAVQSNPPTEDGEIHKLFDIPREIVNDNERQRRLYSPEGIAPTVLARSDSPKILLVGHLDMKAGKQIRSVYDEDGLCPTIDTAQGGHRQIKVLQKPEYTIRKLTPLETFRLQGFSDEKHALLRANGFKDTQLYKMAGNAVTTTVIKALGDELKKYL